MADVTEQIVREAPDIEAYKIGLLKSAKELADQEITLPVQQIAGQTGLQTTATDLATAGIGAYSPYMTEAGYTLGDAQAALGAAYPAGANMMAMGAAGPTAMDYAQFMNPYQAAVNAEINRAYDIQQNQAAGQAVGAGAFGGSRAEIASREVDRNRAAALAQAQAQNFAQAQQALQQQKQMQIQAGQGIGSLGVGAGEALSTLGLRQAALGESLQNVGQKETSFLYDLGKQNQAQQQAEIEAKRQSDMAQLYEPYQRLSFLSDIYKGAPSSQQTIAASTSPSVSPASQFLGLGIAGLSAAAGAQKAGLFG